MERWQQEIQEILREKMVFEDEAELITAQIPEQQPAITFIIATGVAIDITPIEMWVQRVWQSRGEPVPGTGTNALAQQASVDTMRQEDSWIEEGIWVDSCEPYVLRAIDRCCPRWCTSPGGRGVLAVMPWYTRWDLFDLLIFEYTHRYCSIRNGNHRPQISRKRPFTLERSTCFIKHICGAVVLRQRFYRGELRRRGGSFTLQVEERAQKFRILSGLPISYCPTCGMELNRTNTRTINRGE